MNFVGIDLHKKSITVCVVNQGREILERAKLMCDDPASIEAFFKKQVPFQAVVEASASTEWLMVLLQPMADRLVLAHPKKLRIIAESTRKTDKLDAQILAEFLALDMIPQAYRPTPREQEHRALVRQRLHVSRRRASARSRIRSILTRYNADRKDLFTVRGRGYLNEVKVSGADRFVLDQLHAEWEAYGTQLREINAELRRFAQSAPTHEAEARAVLDTVPGVGFVTIEVVTSELGDIRRFRSQKRVCAYAGLAPGRRESAGRYRDLSITKEGSSRLRWVLVEAAWRLVRRSRRWGAVFEHLSKRRGRKRAITAVARRLLCVMVSMLQRGRRYQAGLV